MESPEGVENVRKRRHMLRHRDYAQWRAAKVRLARAPGTRSRWTLIPPHKGILLPPGHPVSLLHDCRDRGRCQGRMKARQKIGARQKSRTQTPRLASPRVTRPARPRAQNPARRHLKVPFYQLGKYLDGRAHPGGRMHAPPSQLTWGTIQTTKWENETLLHFFTTTFRTSSKAGVSLSVHRPGGHPHPRRWPGR